MRGVTVTSRATIAVVAGAVLGCGGHRMEAPIQPAESVRVGYGEVDRRDLTGSVSSLDADELEGVRVSRVEELIRDRVPGVEVLQLPNGDYSFRIRGTRSLMGSNEPLVVIDGMPINPRVMSAALANIAPANVVRIDVLKDAGSTAAYGSRGANGVILITTSAAGRR